MEQQLQARDEKIELMFKEHQVQTSVIRSKYVDKKLEHATEVKKL